MNIMSIIMFIFYFIAAALIMIFYKRYKYCRKSLEQYTEECDRKAARIEKLKAKVKEYADYRRFERTVKIEQVVFHPIELEHSFIYDFNQGFDATFLTAIIMREVSDFMAKELGNNPNLYRVFIENDPTLCREKVKLKIRLLPYPEGTILEEALMNYKEEVNLSDPYEEGGL